MTTSRIRQILCPVDGSETSRHAVRQAAAIARWSGARITALHAASPVYANVPEFTLIPAGPSEDALAATRESLQDLYAADVREVGGMKLVVEAGSPARQILDAIDALGIDLIVMGTHGHTGFERLMVGSVTEKVLRRATCPVLTVPPREVDVSRVPFEHVLCALDFSNCSLAALEYAIAVAVAADSEITLAHVVEWPWEESSTPTFDNLPPTQAQLLATFRREQEAHAIKRLTALIPAQLGTRCHVRVSHGRAYSEILHIALETRADLIVAGVHGRNAVELALFGSTTNQLVRGATCPVLTVRR